MSDEGPRLSIEPMNPFVSGVDLPPPMSTRAGPVIIHTPSDDEPLFAINTTVDGFLILSLLGSGGMGQVLEADDTILGRRVALKVAHPNMERGWLRQEARALASVRHPSLLQIFGFGTNSGLDYAVLERIFGVDLHSFIVRRTRAKEPVPIADALDILLRLAEALAEIHSAGLVHFDVKPANVMLAPKGRVVLMDFGLARGESAVARIASMQGTPAYMAPEVIRGTLDPRLAFFVDAYALGGLGYELLTGRAPFEGANIAQTLQQHLDAEAPSLISLRSDVPKKLSDLIAELLAKDPLERPPSLESVAWRLRRIRDVADTSDEAFRVLIVENDHGIADDLAGHVRSSVPGASVAIAHNAEEAIEVMRGTPVHLLLLDLHIPGMSGVELAMYLRGAHLATRCRIVAVSSGAQWADIGLLRQLGVTDFLRKDERLGERLRPLVYHAFDELQYRRRATGG
jgi:serine/threonine protein kinase